MSLAKRELERRDQCEADATEIAVRAGDLERCEFCETARDKNKSEPEAAIELGDSLLRAGHALTSNFEDRDEMLEALRTVVEQAPAECRCDQNLSPD